jgi:hypothetical protein
MNVFTSCVRAPMTSKEGLCLCDDVCKYELMHIKIFRCVCRVEEYLNVSCVEKLREENARTEIKSLHEDQ